MEVKTQGELYNLVHQLITDFQTNGPFEVEIKRKRSRTLTQNAALHKFCELLAGQLNDAGLDMKQVLRPDIDIPWTKASVKEHLWKPIQEAVISKKSTADANKLEYNEVYEVLNRHLGDKFGIYQEWPNRG